MSSKNHPLISIITVTYQAVNTVEDTIRSVLKQKSVYEYIVIDGGSTDGTVEVIKKYNDKIAYWVSERDAGIYDAMNKGIEKSKGEWLYFLGADDVLLDGVLSSVCNSLSREYSLIYSDVLINYSRKVKSFLNKRIFLQNTVHHQGAFYNANLFKSFRYDDKLKILSDYELNLKIYIEKMPVKKLSFIIASCSDNGASSNFHVSLTETNIIRGRLINSKPLSIILSLILRLYYLQKEIRFFLIGNKK